MTEPIGFWLLGLVILVLVGGAVAATIWVAMKVESRAIALSIAVALCAFAALVIEGAAGALGLV